MAQTDDGAETTKRAGNARGPVWLWVVVLSLQLLVLGAGISREYRLKHEDNNGFHATFARSHLRLGLAVTRGQNYRVNQETGRAHFYAHHPGGPGLVLAAVYGLIGHDGPLTTRATAVGFHLLAGGLFLWLTGLVLAPTWQRLLAGLVFVLVPQSAFFGRMFNHEVLVLPAVILLVGSYWALLYGQGRRRCRMLAMVMAAVWAAFVCWGGFVAMGACCLHAAWQLLGAKNRRALAPLVVLLASGAVLLAADLAHLAWVGGGVKPLLELAASRAGIGAGYTPLRWLVHMADVFRRYFSLFALVALAVLVVTALGRHRSPAAELGLVFAAAGTGYLVLFNQCAYIHHFWQFLLLPAAAIAVAEAARLMLDRARRGPRPLLWRILLVLAAVEMLVTCTTTLVKRHTTPDPYCVEAVQRQERRYPRG